MASDRGPTIPPAKGEEPIGQLPPQDWMEAAETRAVIAALTADGAEVRFVGGCVRDAVLKRSIKDIDIATHDEPQTVLALLDRAGLKAIPTGIAHGTVTAVVGKAHFEVTTLREDVETFGRHARVEFTTDWTADAARRDFTMNAMFADKDGRIFDPFDGLADLAAGRVRFVGRPAERIEEDVLRLLRFFRFYAHYGRPPMDRGALTACRRFAPKLEALSGERVAGELLRLLDAPDPASVLIVMHAEKVLEHVLPDAHAFGRLKMLSWLETRALVHPTVQPDAVRRLASVLETDGAGAERVAGRLKLSNSQTVRLAAIVEPEVRINASMSEQAARRALRHVGADTFRDLLLVAWADERANGTAGTHVTDKWRSLLDMAEAWVQPALPIRGSDVLDLGIASGREVGRLISEVERWWEEADYRPDRAACLARLAEVSGRGAAPLS